MICINCSNQKTSVINSRTHKNNPQVWRRRRCPHCHCTFTTYERVSINDELMVKDSHNKKKPFDSGKLIYDITNCLSHSPKKATQALWLAQTIENRLLQDKELTVSTQTIAAAAHKALVAFDKLAGDQYAVRHRKALAQR